MLAFPVMLVSMIQMAAGVALLYSGAEGLVRGSASLAARLGLTPLVIGLTVVAFGTSMPEMVVSIGAALSGSGDIAVGNVVGSNISNIALILGISALISPLAVNAQVIRFDMPILLAVSVVAIALLLDGHVGRWEGIALTLGLIAYIGFSLRTAKREPDLVQKEFADSIPKATRSVWLDVLFIVGGLALLVVGSRLLVTGAITVAIAAGLSEAVIALTIVAIGTSLPELSTSVVAALKGEGDIAVGNVVGSNLYNTLGILGVTALVTPLTASGITTMDLTVMMVLTIIILPLMRTGFRINRWEGGLLTLTFIGYVIYLLA